ncbi:MAG: DUF4097 family beta strand repeat-containing protein [Acidobacteria bacterium]|nr:DUF4097 family beta strand repeat-containing protein [Acidobacteriota bacterium]
MKRLISIAALAATVVLAFTVQFAGASARQRDASGQNPFRWKGALAAGRVIEIKGINGGIKAEPSAGNEVEVVADKRGRRSNPDDVRIEVLEHGEGVTICAIYPSGEAGKINTCEAGEHWHSHVRNNDVQVDFTVRVPAGVRFNGSTVNGNVDARGLSADAQARTVNGSINLSTTGLARANTVNGSITASLGNANWSNELEFETVNGGIDLSFPSGLSAELHAETVNGDIISDFPVTVQGRFSKRNLNGQIGGGGGRELRLKTVNGNVQIRRAS